MLIRPLRYVDNYHNDDEDTTTTATTTTMTTTLTKTPCHNSFNLPIIEYRWHKPQNYKNVGNNIARIKDPISGVNTFVREINIGNSFTPKTDLPLHHMLPSLTTIKFPFDFFS